MTAIRIRKFDGIAPKLAPKLLPPTYGQTSINCKPWSGNLRPWRDYLTVNSPSKAGDLLSIYYYNAAYWLHWTTDVDVVKGPIASDTKQRIYYTGDGVPKVTNTDLVNVGAGTDYPKDYYTLGIPAPADAPGVSPAGGVGAAETRAYVWTLVSTLGEEGKPSQPTTVAGKVDDTWTISMGKTVAGITRAGSTATANVVSHGYGTGDYILMMGANQAEYNGIKQITVTDPNNFTYSVTGTPATPATGTIKCTKYNLTNGDSVITLKNIYRVNTGTTGADYQFVAQVAVNTTTYADTIAATALGEILPTSNYDIPPTDLKGLTAFPGGIMVGFSPSLNQLCFSEPFQPHAWPVSYRKAIPGIVGIGVYGNTVVAATNSLAYRVTGTHPANMSMLHTKEPYGCLSKRGVVSLGDEGVLFPVAEGIAVIGIRGERILTSAILSKDEWADFKPATLRAKVWNGRYVGFYETEIINGVQYGGGFIIDVTQGQVNLYQLGFFAYALYAHPDDGELYLVVKESGVNRIKKWDAAGTNLSFQFKSGVFSVRKPVNMAYARVLGEFAPLADASQQAACDAQKSSEISANQATINAAGANGLGAINSTAINEVEINGDNLIDVVSCDFTQGRTATFTLYGDDDTLRYSVTVNSDEPFPLPEGFEDRDFSIGCDGKINVEEIAMATSIEELSQ